MNRIYRLVWNRALGALQVASEFASSPQGGNVASAADRVPGMALRPLPRALFGLIALGSMALLASPSAFAQPAVYTVTQSTDDGTGATAGTLSWAIQQVNAAPGSTISLTLASGNTIDVSGPLPAINTATSIDGAADVTINGALLSNAPVTMTGAGTLTLAGDGTSLTSGMTLDSASAVLGGAGASVNVTGAAGSPGTNGSSGVVGWLSQRRVQRRGRHQWRCGNRSGHGVGLYADQQQRRHGRCRRCRRCRWQRWQWWQWRLVFRRPRAAPALPVVPALPAPRASAAPASR